MKRIAWIGCGRHANEMLLPQLARCGLRLVQLCDVDEARLAETAQRLGVTALTRDWRDVEISLIADNWLHNHGEPRGQGAAKIKAAIRDAFYPDEDAWREKCYPRALEIQQTALKGLAAI